MNRRFFLLAAPAIVAAPSLMRISALVVPQAEALRVVSNQITYGLYRSSDGYLYLGYGIAPDDWERAAQVVRGAQSA